MWEDHPVWNVDPVLAPFKKVPDTGRLLGYAGKPNQKAAEVQTKYIIVDMYAKAIQGMDADGIGEGGACRTGEDLRSLSKSRTVGSRATGSRR